MTPSPPLPLSGRSVLIVEDPDLVAEVLRALVERPGGRVLGPAGRVATVIEILAAAKPDLALLDMILDGEEVYAMADALRAPGVPFVFATGYDALIIAPRFHATPHLEKSIALPAFMDALQQIKPA